MIQDALVIIRRLRKLDMVFTLACFLHGKNFPDSGIFSLKYFPDILSTFE